MVNTNNLIEVNAEFLDIESDKNAEFLAKRKVDSTKLIDSDRYEITGKKAFGRGCWGEVFPGIDKGPRRDKKIPVAIKINSPTEIAAQQAEYRQLSLDEAFDKEDLGLVAAGHIVPRRRETDRAGQVFYVMPPYKRSLEEYLTGDERKNTFSVNSGEISLVNATSLLEDISSGLAEINELGIAHSDLRPANILLNEKNQAHITDFGTSTFVAWKSDRSPRDNMGSVYTRAPECFSPNGHPGTAADIWAFGSLTYRMFTGKDILQDEINEARLKSIDAGDYMSSLSREEGNKLIAQKLKLVPKDFRRLLMRCLDFSSHHRIQNGLALKEELQETLKYSGFWGGVKKNAASTIKFATGVAVGAGILGGAIYGVATQKPTEYKTPEIIMRGETGVGNLIVDEVKFEQENFPYKKPASMLRTLGLDEHTSVRMATKSVQVAYLLRAYYDSMNENPVWLRTPTTQHQSDLFGEYRARQSGAGHNFPPMDMQMVARSIEDAITRSKNPSGLVDLEDVCVISRIGSRKLDEARKAASSFDYSEYVKAKNIYGHRIISEKEQEFIDSWRGYINLR